MRLLLYMEVTEFQKYRDGLTKEIRQKPNREERRKILMGARLTNEYREASILKRVEFEEKQTSKAQIEKLSQYAKEHYKIYRTLDREMVELVNLISENRDIFNNETLPSVSDEMIDRILGFIEENKDEEIIAHLKRGNFDYESLLSSDKDEQTKARAILEAVLKIQSYDEAVEQNKKREIDFPGFENDPDIPDAKEIIYQSFGTEILQKCLISKVKYAPDLVSVNIDGVHYYLPINIYSEWEKKMPEVKSRKFRAESFGTWNTDPSFSKKFVPTPINFYSFYGEDPENLNYLNHASEEEKMRQYKLGTVAHEVAHHIYDS